MFNDFIQMPIRCGWAKNGSGAYGRLWPHGRQEPRHGYVPVALAADGTKLQVELLGDFYDAAVSARPLSDPEGARMRN
ncbi:hypothetical protein GCM10010869_59320 [Mesorhizobium tianshanense]|nr:hypothetical protein GCM10010869_59320 [Mesorhizobium tianshanense]